MPDEFYNLAQKKVGNKTEPDWGIKLALDTGQWHEVFNSDIYDFFFNEHAVGNPGGLYADGPEMHGLPHSGCISIPANGILVFARERFD